MGSYKNALVLRLQGCTRTTPAFTWPGGQCHHHCLIFLKVPQCLKFRLTNHQKRVYCLHRGEASLIWDFFSVQHVLVKQMLPKRKWAALIPARTRDGTVWAFWTDLTLPWGVPWPVMTNTQCLLHQRQGPVHTCCEVTWCQMLCQWTHPRMSRTLLQRDECDGTIETKWTSDEHSHQLNQPWYQKWTVLGTSYPHHSFCCPYRDCSWLRSILVSSPLQL